MIELLKGTGTKKWKVIIDGKTIQFGAKGYIDYTLGATEQQKTNYLTRHQKREDWNKSGIYTAGFWSRHLLWNKRSISASMSDIKKKFNI
jgi:Na+-transporting NADH:ubiquinone oxidoreductase subunit NqrF